MAVRSIAYAVAIAMGCFAAVPEAFAVPPADDVSRFPSRPIRILVPFTPGGQPDIFSRLIGQKMTEALGQQIVVDNRPGRLHAALDIGRAHHTAFGAQASVRHAA